MRTIRPTDAEHTARRAASGDAAREAGVVRSVDAQPDAECPTLVTPPRLVAATRDEFRAAALDLVARATEAHAPVAVVDMVDTLDMDASGLGILVLLHKRAKERGIATRLVHTPENVRRLLALTKLEYLFEYADRAA